MRGYLEHVELMRDTAIYVAQGEVTSQQSQNCRKRSPVPYIEVF
jgi:hypothetical protein